MVFSFKKGDLKTCFLDSVSAYVRNSALGVLPNMSDEAEKETSKETFECISIDQFTFLLHKKIVEDGQFTFDLWCGSHVLSGKGTFLTENRIDVHFSNQAINNKHRLFKLTALSSAV